IAMANGNPKIAEAILAGLAQGWPKDKRADLNDETEKAMAKLFTRLSTGAKGQIVRLAMIWGSNAFEKQAAEIGKTLLTTVSDEKMTDNERIATAKQLIEFRASDGEAVTSLLELVTPRTPPQLAGGFLDALTASQSPNVGAKVIEKMEGWSP